MNESGLRSGYAEVVAERREAVRAILESALANNRRFLWEVGCGHGHFLTAYASAHPQKTCVGVDIASDRIQRAIRKRDRAQLANLHFIRADAGLFLQALPPGAELSEVFILFPDPWPKSRHHKHRVLQPEFLAAMARWAARDCRVYFRTDHHPYFQEACATVQASPHWELLTADWPFEFETVFQRRAPQHESLIAAVRAPSS